MLTRSLFLAVAGASLAAAQVVPEDGTGGAPPTIARSLWFGDLDADGRDDVFVVQPDGATRLMMNQGDGTFLDVTERAGLGQIGGAHMAVFGDANGDRRVDLFLPAWRGPSRLLLQTEEGTFVDETEAAGLPRYAEPIDAEWKDVDGDGLADLWLTTAIDDLVYRNAGLGAFEKIDLGLAPRAPLAAGRADTLDAARQGRGLPPIDGGGPGTGNAGGGGPSAQPMCVRFIQDQANPNVCLMASSDPALGLLYPISSDWFVDSATGFTGLGTTAPTAQLHVDGDARVDGTVIVSNGGAPFQVTSTALNVNLNADLLDGFHASDFAQLPLDGGDIDDGTLTGDDIADGSLTAADLGPDSVGQSELAAGSVGSSEVLDDSLTAADLGADSVGSSELAASSVGSAEVIDGSLTAADLGPDSVGQSELAAGSVGSNEVLDDSLTAADLASDSVGSAELAANAVTGANVVDGSLTSADLGNASVGSAELATNSVTGANVVDGSLSSADLGVGSVGTSEVADNSLTANDLAPSSVTSSELGTASVTTSHIVADAITSALVADNTLTANDLATNSVGSAEIASGAVGSDEVANDSLTSNDLAASSVGSSEIAAGAVGNSELAANAVTTDKVLDGTLTGADLAAGTIGGGTIANGSILDVHVNAAAAIQGTKVSPNFGTQTVQTSGIGDFGAGGALTFNVKGDGGNGPTRGYLGAQGATDYDGVTTADWFGLELGVAGISTGTSATDNYGVIGHSNFIGVRGEHSAAPTTNYGALGLDGIGVYGTGTSFAADFDGHVDITGQLNMDFNTFSPVIDVTNGFNGNAARFTMTGTTTTGSAIIGDHDGLGAAGSFTQSNASAITAAIFTSSQGDSSSHRTLHAVNQGGSAGQAAFFDINQTGATGISTWVRNRGSGTALYVETEGSPTRTVDIDRNVSNQTSGQDMIEINVLSGSSTSSQFVEFERGTDIEFRVDVDGDVFADGAYTGPADFAEMIRVSTGATSVEAADVVVIDPESFRSVKVSNEPYSRLVAGVYSTAPGFVGSERDFAGAVGPNGESLSLKRTDMAELYDEVPVAVIGIVPCKVSVENGGIRPGDLLVTSSSPGHAMVDDDPPVGTVVGKALESFDGSAGRTGVIKILVTLQ